MKSLEDIFNTNNFFSIEDNNVLFWGYDLDARIIKITPYVKNLIDKYDFPDGEVIELFDDDTYQFFKEVYTLRTEIN